LQPDEICRVLGVRPDADADTVKSAYRALAATYHPDRNPSADAKQKFIEASTAYAAWSAMHAPADAPETASSSPPLDNVEDVFSAFNDLFGDFVGGKSRTKGLRGGDITRPLKLSVVEAGLGMRKTVAVPRRVVCLACTVDGKPCSRCNGTGQVMHAQGFFTVQTVCPDCKGAGTVVSKICRKCENGLVRKTETFDVTVPPDMKPGMRLRLPNKGDEHPGGTPGHLYLEIVIDNTNTLVRTGDDVTFEAEVTLQQALFGGGLVVETLDGRTTIDVPRFVRDGAVVTLAGKGHARATSAADPYRGDIARGDQRVILRLSRETQLRRRSIIASAVAAFVVAAVALLRLL
jgi:molecular chaperone DnaJ